MEYGNTLIAIAGRSMDPDESAIVVDLLDRLLKPNDANHADLDVLRLVRIGRQSTAFNSLVLYINRCAREFIQSKSAATRAPLVRSLLNLREKLAMNQRPRPAAAAWLVALPAPVQALDRSVDDAVVKTYQVLLGREPVAAEIAIWKGHFDNGLAFHEFLLSVGSGVEGQRHSARQAIMPSLSDGEFIQSAFEQIIGTGAAAWELDHWQRMLSSGTMSRPGMLAELFDNANKFVAAQANAVQHDGKSCLIMGTGTHVTATDWEGQAAVFRVKPPEIKPDTRYQNRFHIKGAPRILVSALASMYRGGEFIEQFMDNITGQDLFDEFFELVIVDADSPENEFETIKRYLGRHKNINYIRCNYRIGIYDAWNVAAKAARGAYLTNANMDDMRRHDSFALQAATLENLPFVDIVYQDLWYTFDPRLSFEEITAFGLQTRLPVITAHNMLRFNSPHNAPMWRKRLHDELGYFDTHYHSAGDYEFWMRCLAAGKKFYKINDPHVVYYQNPKGLSTRPGGRGLAEAMQVNKSYCRKLMAPDVVMDRDEFIRQLDPNGTMGLMLTDEDRYTLAQRALRNAARFQKYSPKEGGQS